MSLFGYIDEDEIEYWRKSREADRKAQEELAGRNYAQPSRYDAPTPAPDPWRSAQSSDRWVGTGFPPSPSPSPAPSLTPGAEYVPFAGMQPATTAEPTPMRPAIEAGPSGAVGPFATMGQERPGSGALGDFMRAGQERQDTQPPEPEAPPNQPISAGQLAQGVWQGVEAAGKWMDDEMLRTTMGVGDAVNPFSPRFREAWTDPRRYNELREEAVKEGATGLLPTGPVRGLAGAVGEAASSFFSPEIPGAIRAPNGTSEQDKQQLIAQKQREAAENWQRWQTEQTNPLVETAFGLANPIGLIGPQEVAQGAKVLRQAAPAVREALPKVGAIAKEFALAGERGALEIGQEAAEASGPFYSQLGRALESPKLPNKASAQQIEGTLKGLGVKDAELAETGVKALLDERLASKQPVTRQELQEAFLEGQVKVEEVVKGSRPLSADERIRAGTPLVMTRDNTKFSQYQLPGAEPGSYRELLMTLPDQLPEGTRVEQRANGWVVVNPKYGDMTPPAPTRQEAISKYAGYPGGGDVAQYRSPHWQEPNVLAHIRFNDRIIDGKKTLLIEEFQSDLTQRVAKLEGLVKRGKASQNQIDELARLKQIPLADRTPQLMMKRAINWAAANGYDRISWTTGKQQVDRWTNALRKNVDRIEWTRGADDQVRVTGSLKGQATFDETVPLYGEIELHGQQVDLEDIAGKKIANDIRDATEMKGAVTGDGLTIGGEGLMKRYDEVMRNVANDIGKRHGARVTTAKLNTSGVTDPAEIQRLQQQYANKTSFIERNFPIVHSLDLTPSLITEAKRGFPLFSSPELGAGLVSAATAFDPDKTMEENAQAMALRGLGGAAGMGAARQLLGRGVKLGLTVEAVKPYYTKFSTKQGKDVWVEVKDAKPIKVPGFEDMDLFIHSKVDINGDALKPRRWVVSDGQTGFSMYEGEGAKARVIEGIQKRLEFIGREKVESLREPALKRHGMSPRYTGEVAAAIPEPPTSTLAEAGQPTAAIEIAKAAPEAPKADVLPADPVGQKPALPEPTIADIPPADIPPVLPPRKIPPTPPEGPLGTLDPPTGPESWLPTVKGTQDILKLAYREDWPRKLADVNPALSQVMQRVGVPLRTIPVQGRVLHESIKADWNSGIVGAMSRLRAQGETNKLFNIDENGIANVMGKNVAISDLLEYPGRYSLNPEQRRYIDTLYKLEDDMSAALAAEGIDVKQLAMDEGGHWVGRRVLGKVDPEGNIEVGQVMGAGGKRIGGKAAFEKGRQFTTQAEALKEGFRYLMPEETLQYNLQAAGKKIADQRLADFILSNIPHRTAAAPEELKLARDFAQDKLAAVGKLKAAINRGYRGERLPHPTVASIGRFFPEQAKGLIEAGITKMEDPIKRARLQEVERGIPGLKAQAQADYHKAVNRLSKASEEARRKRYGEDIVQTPALQGKFFEAKDAAEIRKMLDLDPKGKVRSAAEIVSWANALPRLLLTTMDLGGAFIQLQLIGFSHPDIWAKSVKDSIGALASARYNQKFMEAHADTIKKWGAEGAIFTPSEFTETATAQGALTKIPLAGKAAQPFIRSWETLLNAAKIYGLEATEHLAKTPEEMRDLATFWNEMSGVANRARMGISPTQSAVESAAMFAPRYNAAVLALITDVARGGLRGKMARESLGKALAGGLAGYVGVSYALGQEPHLDPREGGKFLTVEVAGQRIGMGGAFLGASRMLAQIVLDPGKAHEYAGRFLQSRVSPAVGLVRDVLPHYDATTGTLQGPQDFMGRSLDTPLKLTKRVLGDNLLPIWAQAFTEADEDWTGAGTRAGVEFLGGRSFPTSPAERRNAATADVAKKLGMAPEQVGFVALDKLRRENPELARLAQEATRTYAEQGSLYHDYKQKMDAAATRIEDKMATNKAELDAGRISGKEYRERIQILERDMARRHDTLVEDNPSYQAALGELEKQRQTEAKQSPAEDRFVLDWYQITQDLIDPKTGALGSVGELVDRREALKEKYSPEVVKAGLEYLNRRRDPQYVQAMEEYREYREIEPQLSGMSPEQLREAVAFANRRKDIAQSLPPSDSRSERALRMAALEDNQGYLLYQRRLQIERSMVGKRITLMKQQYWATHPLLQKFFSASPAQVPVKEAS